MLVLLGILSSYPVFAGGEELSTSGEESENVSENSTAAQSVGIGKFASLPFHVSVSVRSGYDDNVATAPFDRQGSVFLNVNFGLTYNFGTPRTTFTLQTAGGITKYFDQSSGIDFDFNPSVNFSIVHKATPRLTLSLTSYFTYQNVPDFTFNAGLNRRSGSFFYSTNKFSAAYQWRPRFSTVSSYTLGLVWYPDSAVGDFENRVEQTFGNEFRFLLWPTTTLVGEYRFAVFTYASSVRDSITQFFLGGFDHTFSPRFSVGARAGVEIRSFTELDTEQGNPYFEGNLTYALGPHFTLSSSTRYSIEDPGVPGSQSRTTFRTGLTATYKVTPRITAGLTGAYQHDENDGSFSFFFFSPPFSEDTLAVSLSLRYAINHTWGAELGYDFTDVVSDIRLREYYRNRLYGGVNFTF